MKDKRIVVLHFGYADDDMSAGVTVAIPQMISAQSEFADVLFVNLFECKKTDNTVLFSQYNTIQKLPGVFSKPDIVVFHEIYRPQYIRLYRECLRKKIPYIIIPHGGLTKTAQQKKHLKKISANIMFFNAFINNAKKIQYLSDDEMKSSIKSLSHFIKGNGIEIGEYIEHRFEKATRLVFIGRYDIFFKGLDLLIEAVSLIKSKMISKKILIDLYGKGSRVEENAIRSLINSAGVSDVLRMHGPVYDNEKKEVLINSTFFIQTSRSEGQPLGIMEAMALGLPVIVTPGTSLMNAVIDNEMGFGCSFDSNGIGQAIIKAAEEKEKLPFFSKNAYTYAKEHFDNQIIAKETINEFFRIVRG